MNPPQQPTGESPDGAARDPGHEYFEHMVLLAAEDRFGPETTENARKEAATYLVDNGDVEDLATAAEIVAERERRLREELASGSA